MENTSFFTKKKTGSLGYAEEPFSYLSIIQYIETNIQTNLHSLTNTKLRTYYTQKTRKKIMIHTKKIAKILQCSNWSKTRLKGFCKLSSIKTIEK